MKNFSDYIPIVVAVCYGLYHLVGMVGKSKVQKPKNFPPPVPSSNSPERAGGDQGWDDLLEALGQKETSKGPSSYSPPRVETVVPKIRPAVIPSIPRATPKPPLVTLPEIPKIPVSTPISESYEFYQPTIANETALKFQTFDSDNATASHAPPALTSSILPGINADRLRNLMKDHERLRETIVLNEILGKPVALR